jgi:Protein of unknown function (DUF3592)
MVRGCGFTDDHSSTPLARDVLAGQSTDPQCGHSLFRLLSTGPLCDIRHRISPRNALPSAYMIATFSLVGGLVLASSGSLLFAKRIGLMVLAHYPKVPASVESANVYRISDERQPYVGGVMYGYVVDGLHYSGWCASCFSTEQEAWDYVSDCRAQKLTVWYKPEDPRESHLFGAAGSRLTLLRRPRAA